MRTWLLILAFVMTFTVAPFAAEQMNISGTREQIRIIHQDISKWDKNGDGKLTGSERDAFTAAKRKEMADAAAAAQAAKAKPTTISRTVKPVLSPEDAQKRTPKGVPKNIEDSASVQRP
jgi:hypothetical protein